MRTVFIQRLDPESMPLLQRQSHVIWAAVQNMRQILQKGYCSRTEPSNEVRVQEPAWPRQALPLLRKPYLMDRSNGRGGGGAVEISGAITWRDPTSWRLRIVVNEILLKVLHSRQRLAIL